LGPFRGTQDDDVLEVASVVAALLEPQEDLTALGADFPAGQVQGRTAHPLGHLFQSQPEAA